MKIRVFYLILISNYFIIERILFEKILSIVLN